MGRIDQYAGRPVRKFLVPDPVSKTGHLLCLKEAIQALDDLSLEITHCSWFGYPVKKTMYLLKKYLEIIFVSGDKPGTNPKVITIRGIFSY